MKQMLLLTAVGCLLAGSATAQNQLLNPGFDASTAFWSIFVANDATRGHSSNDASGSPSSGSLMIDHPSAGQSVAFQCVAVSPSTPWLASVAVEILGGGSVSLLLQWSDAPNCANGGDEVLVASQEGPNSWTNIGGTSAAPSDAVSANVLVRTGSPGSATFFVDDAVLALPEPTGGVAGAVAAGAALLCARRRRRLA